MAQKKITDLQLRSDFDETCNLPTDDATQTWRVTGEQVKDFIGDELVPLTTKGDLLVQGTSTPQRLAGNISTTPAILTQTGTGAASDIPVWRTFKPPTVQKLVTGTAATYTTPSGALWLKIRMIGGGGGGGGSTGTNPGGAGGDTTFGTSLLTAKGGSGGPGGGTGGPGPGGVAGTINSPALEVANFVGTAGPAGQNPGALTENLAPGSGGNSPFGGAGAGNTSVSGGAAAANTGSGGAGGAQGSALTGSGGGAGNYVEAIIPNPGATYTYTIGAAGTAGSAGSQAGGAGAAGIIIVEEHYQ